MSNTPEEERHLLYRSTPRSRPQQQGKQTVAPSINQSQEGDVYRISSASGTSTSEVAVEEAECGGFLGILFDPRSSFHRFFILIFLCFISFGSYFCYDNPAAIQDVMIRELKLSNSDYTAFYEWYSWPNVILCFFGGFLIDRVFGIRLGTLIFSCIVTIGQLVFAFGALNNMYWLMVVGRFIFGVGGESLAVAANNYVVKWFSGRELNMVFGLQLSVSRLGSTINMNIMNHIYHGVADRIGPGYQALGWALFIASIFCFYSLLCGLFMAYFDKRADRILRRQQGGTNAPKVNITDVTHFPIAFWLICVICVFYYVSVFPFVGNGLMLFMRKFELSHETADGVNSIIYVLSAVISPFAGLAIDKLGLNIFWIMGSTFLTGVAHALVAFTFIPPIPSTVLMGISYACLASSLWPLVSYVVPTHQLGTAYGAMQSIQNLGLALTNRLIGVLLDSHGYLIMEAFFLGSIGIALIAGSLLFITDATMGGKLNRTGSERRRIAAEEAAAAAKTAGHSEQLSE